MKKFLNAIIVLIAFHSSYSSSQEIEETVVITSAFIDTAEINNPLYIMEMILLKVLLQVWEILLMNI